MIKNHFRSLSYWNPEAIGITMFPTPALSWGDVISSLSLLEPGPDRAYLQREFAPRH